MKKPVFIGCGIMLAAVLVGCGSSGPDAIAKEQISLLDQMTAIMEKVTDKKSLDEANTKIKELSERSKELDKKAKALTPEQLKDMEKKYKTQIEESLKKFMTASAQAMTKALGGGLKIPDFKGLLPK